MRRLNPFIAVLSALAISVSGLMTAAPALAYNISAVYKDCEANGQLNGHYSRAQLQAALNAMPSEVAEYSACSAIIQQALLRASSRGGGSGSTSKTSLAAGGYGRGGGPGGSGTGSAAGHNGKTGASTRDGRSAGAGSAAAVNLAGSSIRPGSTGTTAAGTSLPMALVVVLILLALTALSGGAVAIRRRVVARHGT
jgi:hypothetical protein